MSTTPSTVCYTSILTPKNTSTCHGQKFHTPILLSTPALVGSRSPDGWDQIPRWAGGWALHHPPWSFGFDSQTRGTRENRAPPCVKEPGSSRVPVRDGQTSPHQSRLVVSRITCPPLSLSPHANSFITGAAVINTHTPFHTISLSPALTSAWWSD